MTKIEALTSIAQTVLRNRRNWDAAQLSDIANTVAECALLVSADVSEQNAVIIELARRARINS